MSTVTDPIADLLARVRNGAQAQKPELFVPYSKIKAEVARILKDEGYITDYELDRSAAHPRIKITNKLVNRSCAITGLRRVSRPGLRRYVGAQEIPRVLGGMGIAILSTPRGVLSGREAKKQNVGGEFAGLRLVSFMSRIGNKSIALPDKVKVNVGNDGAVAVEGPKGKLNWKLPRDISAKVENNHVSLARAAETRSVKALHGLSRALLNNMVRGVSEGFSKDLEIEGVGFKAAVQGQKLNLSLGFSHPILFPIPKDIKIVVTENTKLTISGIDKKLVGQVAADIRRYYPPEPYKGKGVRYAGEQIRRKEGKTVQ